MKFYLASNYGRRDELKSYEKDLSFCGHTVTSTWLNATRDSKGPMFQAMDDLHDLLEAEGLILFVDGPTRRGGRETELGIAIGTNKEIYLVGERINIFHHLPRVHFFSHWNDCCTYLETT